MPVVIGSGGGGVLFHEACGHGLEADLVGKGASVFKGRRGELVASPLVTLVDDGTMAEEWGCFAIDDEGTPAGRNVLIEDGILTDYMWDFLRARKEGRPRSGNGRRQSYQHLPMVRMTNTYVLAGKDDPADIVAGTDHGVFIKSLGGGQVNTATGDFVFGMTEAYLIEDGEITDPIREGNLIGNGPKVLTLIDAVGNDFAMGPPGMCGKDGQGVPVGDGVPTLRVTELTDRRHRGASVDRRRTARPRRQGRRVGPATASRSRRSSSTRRDTDIRVYEGEIEKLSSAESQGVGIRVVRDHRQGFASRGHVRRRRARRDAGRGPRQRRFRHAGRAPRPGRSRRRARRRARPLPRCARRLPHGQEDRPRARARAGRARAADPRIYGRRGVRLRRLPLGQRGRRARPASGRAAAAPRRTCPSR